MTREPIYAALFSLLSSATNFKTKGRRLKLWQEVPPESQPAFFQVQKTETCQQKDGAPSRWLMSLDLVVYVNVGEGIDEVATKALNPIIDAITAKLEPSASAGVQTLGGLVRYARVNGIIETDEGSLGAQAVAIIPVEILTERDWAVAPT